MYERDGNSLVTVRMGGDAMDVRRLVGEKYESGERKSSTYHTCES